MAIFHGELSKHTFKRSIILCSADKKNNVLTFVIGVLLVYGDFGKNGQLHPYSRACLIFLVRQTSLLVLYRWSEGDRTGNLDVLKKCNKKKHNLAQIHSCAPRAILTCTI